MVFEGGVGGIVGAFDGQRRYGDVAVDGGVAVDVEIVVVAVYAMPDLTPSAVAEVDKVVREVRTALFCEQYALWIFGNIDVEDIAACKNVVFAHKIVYIVKPLFRIVKTLNVG